MITLERTQDMAIVRGICTDPRIWNAMTDDFSPAPEDYKPPADGAIYVLVRHDGHVGGMFVLVPRTAIRYEIHTLLLPSLSPWRKLEAASRICEWVWQNTPCQSLLTEVPVVNSAALWFAKAAGMMEIGVEPNSFQKGGVLYDTVILSKNRKPVEEVAVRA